MFSIQRIHKKDANFIENDCKIVVPNDVPTCWKWKVFAINDSAKQLNVKTNKTIIQIQCFIMVRAYLWFVWKNERQTKSNYGLFGAWGCVETLIGLWHNDRCEQPPLFAFLQHLLQPISCDSFWDRKLVKFVWNVFRNGGNSMFSINLLGIAILLPLLTKIADFDFIFYNE